MRGLEELDELDRVFGALAHRTRRAILVTLMANGGTMASGNIAGGMNNTWQTTSRHLRVLEEAGLVKITLQGRGHVYTLQAGPMRTLLAIWLRRFDDPKT
jgi:DNA-binding transcriptional ArsR family regulator